MALVLANRVQESATPNTTVSFTLTGAVLGFETFSVIGNGNTTYYSATDTAGNWEVGLGTYSSTGPTLTRTTIYASNNSNLAVTFPGTVNVFVTYPSGRSVSLDASGNVSALGTVSSGTWEGSPVGVAYGGTGGTSSSGPNSVMLRDANQNVAVNRLNQANTTTTASASTTILTAASSYSQTLVGTGNQDYAMPDATGLTTGLDFIFNNNATGTLTLRDYAGGVIGTVASGGACELVLLNNGTVAGTWDLHGFLPEGVTFGTNAFNLGTSVISGGTWQGGTIQPDYGGTGLTSFVGANNALYSTGFNTLTAGTLPVAAGGTGLTSYFPNQVFYAASSSAVGQSSNFSFNGTTLTVNTLNLLNPLATNYGGTGLTSFTANGVVYASSTSALTTSSSLTFDGSVFSVNAIVGATKFQTSPGGPSVGDGMYSPVSNTLAWSVSSSEQMRLTTTGLGIGTSSPTNRLSVSGNANITGNTTLGSSSSNGVTINGYVGQGGAPAASTSYYISGTATSSGTNTFGFNYNASAPTSTTNAFYAFTAGMVADASATISSATAFNVSNLTLGSGATVTDFQGIDVGNLTAGTNNYGVRTRLSSGSNKWNIYSDGTADSFFNGRVGLSVAPMSTGANGSQLQIGNPISTAGAGLTIGATATGDIQFSNATSGAGQYSGLIRYAFGTTTMSLWTNSGQRVTIDGSGNVGIGTTSPSGKLDVRDANLSTPVYIQGNPTNAAGLVLSRRTTNNISGPAIGIAHISFQAFNDSPGTTLVEGARIRAETAGNWGATSTPANLIFSTVASGSTTLTERARITSEGSFQIGSSTAADPRLFVYDNDTTDAAIIVRQDGTAPIQIWQGASGSERMRIDSAGYVGIRTTSPAGFLHVAPGSAAAASTAGAPIILQAQTGGSSASGGNILIGSGQNGSGGSNGYIAFGIGSSTSGSAFATGEAMRLDASGNLGIGTTSPGARLNLEGAGPIQALLRTTGSTSYTSLRLYNNINSAGRALEIDYAGSAYSGAFLTGGPSGEQGSIATTGSYPLVLGTNNTARVTIDSSGNVGIGTASPLVPLTVQRTAAATNTRITVAQLNRATSGTAAAGLGGYLQLQAQDDAGTQREAAVISWDLSDVSAAAPKGRLYLGTRNANDAVVIDNSGNLGLGVTPSAWNSVFKVVEVGAKGGALLTQTSQYNVILSSNAYYDSVGWKYGNTAAATYYDQNTGQHRFFTAPSGTAGTAITFTQAMTLDASGNLLVNRTAVVGSEKLSVNGSARFETAVDLIGGAGTPEFRLYQTSNNWSIRNSSGALSFYDLSGSAERARITSVGNFSIGGTANRATTVGTAALNIFNGTAPVGTLANGISIYSAAGEAYVMDAAGNATLFSPHDAQTNEWIFKSKHTPTGKVLRIDVEKLLRFVNDHFGLDAVQEFIEE